MKIHLLLSGNIGQDSTEYIHPCEIYPSENNISGSFTTYELKIKQSLPGGVANTGDKIYFVQISNKHFHFFHNIFIILIIIFTTIIG